MRQRLKYALSLEDWQTAIAVLDLEIGRHRRAMKRTTELPPATVNAGPGPQAVAQATGAFTVLRQFNERGLSI